jgi:hypothetical protein
MKYIQLVSLYALLLTYQDGSTDKALCSTLHVRFLVFWKSLKLFLWFFSVSLGFEILFKAVATSSPNKLSVHNHSSPGYKWLKYGKPQQYCLGEMMKHLFDSMTCCVQTVENIAAEIMLSFPIEILLST